MKSSLTEDLQAHFGFSAFRPGQQEAIQSLLQGRHSLVVMPTGAGKSLVFQLAALKLDGLTLVISPLIALMKDQVDSLTRRDVPATYINSALPTGEQRSRLAQLARGKFRMVYIAPERLRNAQFLEAIQNQNISLLAVDEAHCISEWGHDFRPDYLHIASFRNKLNFPLAVALTATATPQVQEEIIRLLGLGKTVTRIVTGFNRPNLTLSVRYAGGPSAKLRVLKELLSVSEPGAVMIYTGTRRDAEEIAGFVREMLHLPAEYYHAGLPSEERARIQNEFLSGRLNYIAATNAFGMGIDRADVRQVIHYSLPGSLEAYYQEAGRAGRDGLPARITLIYDPQDRALQEFFIQQSEVAAGDLHALYNAIRRGEAWITTENISYSTGLHPVQIRVGLAELERVGALDHLGDEGLRMLIRKGAWDDASVEQAAMRSKAHLRQRQKQLDGIIRYAETNECRRKIILNHFGDRGSAASERCCDNCVLKNVTPLAGKAVEVMSHSERMPLVILDCIRRTKFNVGREKIIQILIGSKAKDILKFHYDENVYYGRMSGCRKADIDQLVLELIELGYIKVIGGNYPVLSLTPLGENAIQHKTVIQLGIPKGMLATDVQHRRAQRDAGGTIDAYLSRPHPRPLNGPWQVGWALDFHSRFSGEEWSRSGLGDLAYRLKYAGDISTLPALVAQSLELLNMHPELAQVDMIVPVPSSTERDLQPVSQLCEALAERITLPVRIAVVKSRQTRSQKEMQTLAQKRANVDGAFRLAADVKGQRILLVDDLFDSGATLETITRLLQKGGAASVTVLTLTRTIHSDA